MHTRNIGRTAGARDGDDNACVVALAGCHRRLSRSPEGSLSDSTKLMIAQTRVPFVSLARLKRFTISEAH